jgi:anti-sigma factor RsiW
MSFSCTDKDTLIAYVYGECDDTQRAAVEAHLATCAACADEVGGFGRVRTTLSEWTPPDRVGSFRLVREEEVGAQTPARILRPARWWQAPVPALAKVAAGILLFAGGAALANLEVRYDSAGFAVRTGWQKAPPAEGRDAANQPDAPATQAAPPLPVAPVPAAALPQQAAGGDAPWRTEMAALERQLRDEFRQQVTTVRTTGATAGPVGIPAAATAEERRFLGAVQAMIEDSAERQQLWTSYRINQVMGEFQTQRRADLARVQQNLDRLDAGASAITAPRGQPSMNNLFPVTLKK